MERIPKELQEIVERRNILLEQAFSELKDQVRIIGNPQSPAILFNDSIIISSYVKNFNLYFTDKPYEGKVVGEYKLRKDFILPKEKIKLFLKASEHRKIYRIVFNNSSLFLTGWNYRNSKIKEGLYPVFARHNPKVYFTKKKAEEILQKLEDLHYTVNLL